MWESFPTLRKLRSERNWGRLHVKDLIGSDGSDGVLIGRYTKTCGLHSDWIP